MGLLDKCRALGYSRSSELMADVRMLEGKCKQAVSRWGGDPDTGGGFGGGAGRVVVRAMDTLAANMESMLARSREEVRGRGRRCVFQELKQHSHTNVKRMVFSHSSTLTLPTPSPRDREVTVMSTLLRFH